LRWCSKIRRLGEVAEFAPSEADLLLESIDFRVASPIYTRALAWKGRSATAPDGGKSILTPIPPGPI
jgi:hypothetical protein